MGWAALGLALLRLRLWSSGPNMHPGFSDAPGETEPHSLTRCLARVLAFPTHPAGGGLCISDLLALNDFLTDCPRGPGFHQPAELVC